LYTSPAIDAGDNAICANAPVSNLDQRGEPRPQDGDRDNIDTCDLGAYEVEDPRDIPTISVSNSPVTYNGSPQAAIIAPSVAGTISNILYNGSATVPSAIGTYVVTADFAADDTYNYQSLTGAAAGDFVIDPEYTAPTVDIFTAVSPSSSLTISITTFTASDNVAVTGYIITESSTAPAFDAAGWAGSAPTTYPVTADGSYTLYPWAKDASGNVSAVYGSPAAVIVDAPPPSVSSVTRSDSNPTGASSIDFTITFSESVTGVDTADFSLTTTGAVSGESITGVSGSGDSYTVTVATGTGDGTIRLDVLDDDSIIDIDSLPLDGGFTSGEVYEIDRTAPDTSLDVTPTDPSSDTSPTFEFSSLDGTAVFECQLDGGGFSACTSPHSFTDLSEGAHTFDVRAVDLAGNTDATPESYTWTIEAGGILFWDDFETGDFSRWSRFNDGKGYLYPCTDAALNGSYGACVDRGTDNRKQLIDETPVYQTAFTVQFNLDMNSLKFGEGERFRFMQVKMGAERPFFIVVKYDSGQYLMQLNTLLDDLTKVKTGWYLLNNAPRTIEVNWKAASPDGANDGWIEFYLEDTLLETLSNLDNDTIFVDTFKIGFTSRLDGKSLSGIFYLDDIYTSNGGYIGTP
ncbi:MAG: choice-of-anchor Q domain-containing protein, partial [Chloroflexota bacterium]